MNNKTVSSYRVILVLLICFFAFSSTVFAQTSSFTYQGKLTDSSAPAAGVYDYQFALYDSVTGGNQLGTTQTITSVSVANGAFTVQLDFGSSVFPGADRFLEISVKKPSEASYTTLSPRQQIKSAPYSIRSLNATNADNAANAVTATTATTASGVSSSAGDSVVAAINAGSSTINAARLPSTLATQDGTNAFGGTNIFSTAPIFGAGLSASNQRVTDIATPTAGTDAATKAYVDMALAAGSYVQFAPSTQQMTGSTNHLINLKLVSTDPVNHKLGTPGVNALLSLSASGTYTDNSTHDKERFRVDNDGSILSVADYTGGVNTTAPAEGSGTRFMWYAAKAALRAGQINGTQWDDANIGLYSTAFGENVRALGDNSIVVGKNSVAANTGTVALGEGHTATGANSVALGYGASTSTINGAPRTGTFVFSDRSVPLTYSFNSTSPDINSQFHPTVTNSFNVRAVNGSFFYTNTALSTGFIFNSTTATMTLNNSKLTMASDGTTTLTSNSGGSAGVTLPAGGGAWNNLSDRHTKDNFRAVNPREILRGVLNLPISTWNYRTQNASIRHIGAMAQDFKAAFQVGEDDKHISTIDPDGVALAAIQGLNAEMIERTTRLQAENDRQRRLITALEERLLKLERAAPRRRTTQRRKQ
jgi:hypothetical protein